MLGVVTTDPAIADGAAAIKDALLATAGTVLPFAAALAAIPLGWRWVRKFVK